MTSEICVEKPATTSRVAEASVAELLAFERLLSDLSARFAISSDQIEAEIESALKKLLKFLDFDRSNFVEFTAEGGATILCSVATAGVERYPPGPAPAFLSWYNGQARAGNLLRVRSIDDLPPEAVGEIEYYRRSGIRSSLGIPLRVGGRIVGLINFSAFRPTPEWPDDLITRLKVVGEVMAQALVRGRSEAALRASEQRWRSMFQASNLGIAMLDQNLRYLATNRAFQAMLGYTDEELRKRTSLDVAVEEDRELAQARLADLHQGKLGHYDVMRQYRRKDGTVMWGHSYISVASYAESKPNTFLETTIDVTESKRSQDVLRATQSELTRITRLTTMGEMAASIAHELKQPLAAIVANGDAGLFFLTNSTPDVDGARGSLRDIVSDAYRASQVIEGIRAMFKRDAQEMAPVKISQLIQEVLVVLRGEMQNGEISMQTELAENLPDVFADRVQLRQVIFNLTMNAIEAMLSVSDRIRVLRIQAACNESRDVQITVEDSGVGIDPRNADRIFDAFFTTKSSGMGMGLSICRSIIEAHKGRLWASPGADCGSMFQVVLPPIRD